MKFNNELINNHLEINKATKQQSNKATKQQSNKATKQQINPHYGWI